jgi:uncharacterized coiled-coil DUF342 family protein
MNNSRRKQIAEALDQWATIQVALDNLRSTVEEILDEEQDYYDNMPESFQNGEKGERASEAIENLDNAVSELDEAFNFDIEGYLNGAAE